MTRNHSSDGLLFSTLFMSEQERHQVFKAYCKQSGYKEEGSPLYTMLTILIGEIDEIFEGSFLEVLLDNWQVHCAFVL